MTQVLLHLLTPLKSQTPFSAVPKQENVNHFDFIGATYTII